MNDKSKIELVSGAPVPDDRSHIELKENGQQKDYIVLTAEERAKGFVRPYREAYCHVGKQPKFPLRDLTDEERVQYTTFGYVKYETYPESESPLCGKFWTTAELNANACGTVTTMARSIAETYARDPSFYSGTFCVRCGQHYPLNQFVWDGTNEQVGS